MNICSQNNSFSGAILNPSDSDCELNPEGCYLWIDEDVDGLIYELHQRYMKRAIGCSGGRNRNVFIMPGGYVVKLPKNFAGIGDNDWEGSVSNTEDSTNDPYHIQYPKTRLGYYAGDIPVVFMEFVEALTHAGIVERLGYYPDWVLSVDCGQVGVNKGGRLVAYDYGPN
jgi:hypothetical protein